MNKSSQRFQQYQNTKPNKKEGEVTLETKKSSSTSTSKDVGDYVDFEEVDE